MEGNTGKELGLSSSLRSLQPHEGGRKCQNVGGIMRLRRTTPTGSEEKEHVKTKAPLYGELSFSLMTLVAGLGVAPSLEDYA